MHRSEHLQTNIHFEYNDKQNLHVAVSIINPFGATKAFVSGSPVVNACVDMKNEQ